MSQAIHCDGCGAELGSLPLRERLIHGQRDEHSGQGMRPLPDGGFDWCERCAKVAFQAVLDANVAGGRR